jgi:hypothetical protein
MPDFLVTWETCVEDVHDHREAASRALAVQRDPESIATVFAVRQLDAHAAAYHVDLGGDVPVAPQLEPSQAASALRAAGWPEVAHDLDHGRPAHEILAWLREIPDCAPAAAIVCRVHEDRHPALSDTQIEASAHGFAAQLYLHDSACEARNFDLGQHHGPDPRPAP